MFVRQLVNQAWTTSLVTVQPDVGLWSVMNKFHDYGVGALVVSADGVHVDGLLTEADIVTRLPQRGSQLLRDSVDTVMTTEVLTCALRDTVAKAVRKAIYGEVSHLPVVDGHNLCGVLSLADLMGALLEEVAFADLAQDELLARPQGSFPTAAEVQPRTLSNA